jgi:hypothetical protein
MARGAADGGKNDELRGHKTNKDDFVGFEAHAQVDFTEKVPFSTLDDEGRLSISPWEKVLRFQQSTQAIAYELLGIIIASILRPRPRLFVCAPNTDIW